MPQIKSQEKRVRTNAKRNLAVSAKKSEIRTQMKKVFAAVEAGDKEAATTAYASASSKLDKAVGKGIYHKNYASRQKAKLMRAVNSLA